MLSNEQVVKNLNLTGNFLEAAIFSELAKSGHFLVLSEWPFSQPNFQGTADVIALNHHVESGDEPLVFFAIECKKVRQDQKVWIFDKSRASLEPYYPFLKITSDNKFSYDGRTGYQLPNAGIPEADKTELFNKAYELREHDGNLSRDQSERVYAGLTQANRALVGLVKQNHRLVFNLPSHFFEGRQTLFVPILVTNAELRVISYNPENIDKKSGEIDHSKVSVESKNWLIFDYPLTNELQLIGAGNNTTLQPIKRPTFIVSSQYALELMEIISDNAEY